MVAVDRRGKAQQSLQHHVNGGGGGQIAAAHDARHSLRGVVDHDAEVVGDGAVLASYDRVAHGGGGILRQVEAAFVDGLDAPALEAQPQRFAAAAPARARQAAVPARSGIAMACRRRPAFPTASPRCDCSGRDTARRAAPASRAPTRAPGFARSGAIRRPSRARTTPGPRAGRGRSPGCSGWDRCPPAGARDARRGCARRASTGARRAAFPGARDRRSWARIGSGFRASSRRAA